MLKDLYDGFKCVCSPVMCDSSTIIYGNDGTLIKKAYDKKASLRLENEYKCLMKLQDEDFVPKILFYDSNQASIRMTTIDGVSVFEFANKYNHIPMSYAKQMAEILLRLIELDIEYGGDSSKLEHYLINEKTEKLYIIDFGISNLISNNCK